MSQMRRYPVVFLYFLFCVSCSQGEAGDAVVIESDMAAEDVLSDTTGDIQGDGLDEGDDEDGCSPDCTEEYTLRTAFGSMESLDVVTEGIYAIWWDARFEHLEDTGVMFSQLQEIRRDCLDNLGMADPPNPPAGYYYNVYIHHGEEDIFPVEWGNGQGTDIYGMPFLTLPDGYHTDTANLYHEGFHIFQYSANSPGFVYAGDSQWYVESTAQWYQSKNLPDDEMAFVEAGAIVGNPQLALWHSFSNEAPGDPTDWLFQVRQYGMHTYLFYLSEVAGVDPAIFTDGFYEETSLSPQEYHYVEVGGDLLRGYFADWAAHNTGGLDYLTPAQVERAQLEVEWVGDPENLHPYVLSFSDTGTDGEWVRPAEEVTARSWAYNVIEIETTEAATYTFNLQGDPAGSEGAASHFEGRMVVMGAEGAHYSELIMTSDLDGEGVVAVEASDTAVYLVVVSVPEHFTGYQTHGYNLLIHRE